MLILQGYSNHARTTPPHRVIAGPSVTILPDKGDCLSRNDKSSNFDRVRDELFSHIHRCGVLKASEEQQVEWMDDTVEYMGERYPDLGREELGELRMIGMRFCRPVISRVETEETPAEDGAEAGEAVGASAAA